MYPALKIIALIALAAAVLAIAPAGARSPARAKCFPPKSKELVRSRHTRVYLDRRSKPYDTVACSYDTGRREFLSDEAEGIHAFPPPALDLSAVLVGFVQYDNSDPVNTGLLRIRVISVRSGRDKSPPTGVDPGRGDGRVGRLQITGAGSVAWIVCPFSEPPDGNPNPACTGPGDRARLWKQEPGSGPVLLDDGTDIDPGSLGLRGSSLRWLRAGQPRTATLE